MPFLETIRGKGLGRSLAALVLFTVVGLQPARSGAADSETALEFKVKAGYLFNFAKFVEWPQTAFTNASAPFVIGLLGEDSVGRSLEAALAGQTINGRGFYISRLGLRENLGHCHILFVSRSEKTRAAHLLESVLGHPVLTVGEIDRFGQLGGMINFILVSGQVKLETNPGAAAAAGLKISSKLLALSKTVKTEPPRK